MLYSEEKTKKIIENAYAIYDEPLDTFLCGSCHALAYAMWLNNERRGKILACMRVESDLDQGGAQPYCVSYAHMCYEDLNGSIWDIEGKNADVRYEEEQFRSISKDDDDSETTFEWIEIHPNNLFTFLKDWGATKKIQTDMIDRLCDSTHERPPSEKQNELFEAPETHFDLDQAPFDNSWYRSLSKLGFLNGKTQIDPTQKQKHLFI